MLSLFLFNLALADIGDYIPQTLPSDVRVAVYVDDIAVFVARPTDSRPHVRTSVQCVLDAIDAFIGGRGMQLPPTKTEALMMHHSSVARHDTPRFTLQCTAIPWSRQVK